MKFQFNVSVSEDDYIDYNTFWMLRSPYGNKANIIIRISIAVLIGLFVLLALLDGGFSTDTVIEIILLLIALVIFQIFITRFCAWFFKIYIRSLKKKGKMGYSPSSVIEFYEDSFVETTQVNKTEQKYSVVERISIVDNKMIYIHINNVMAYMLPLSSFESKEQYDSFLDFIKTKCATIDIY